MISFTIAPDDVAATVVEYRPVYVMGDVSKPGQYPFQAAMTARQAVAVSGGYDLLHMGNQKAWLEASDLQSEYNSVMVHLAGLALRETRVKSELANLETMDQTLPPDIQVPAATLSALVHAENELFKTRRAEFEFEKGFFERSLKQTAEVMEGLNEQFKQEGHGAVADARELEDLMSLQKKGYASNTRVTILVTPLLSLQHERCRSPCNWIRQSLGRMNSRSSLRGLNPSERSRCSPI